MTFIDASAIVAILAREADAAAIIGKMESEARPFAVTPLTVFDAAISLARAKLAASAGRKPRPMEIRAALAVVLAFLEANGVEEIAISPDLGRRAVEAAALYGKATGHPADLNFGDCFVYASAKSKGARILCKGDDFARTDLA